MKKIIAFFLVSISVITIGLLLLSLRQPSHDRDWVEDLVVLPEATFVDESVVISGVRDWRYEGNSVVSKDYTVRTIDPDDVHGAWFIIEPFSDWDGIAHTYISFDVEGQNPIVVSVEARKERDENFSAWKGLFNNFELIYTWGEEPDFIGRRAIFLNHDQYMYPLQIDEAAAQRLFLAFINATISVQEQPRFYNTLFHNCTNTLAQVANTSKPGTIPLHYARVFTGFSDELLFELGYFPEAESLEELQREYEVSEFIRSMSKEQQMDFSNELRYQLGR